MKLLIVNPNSTQSMTDAIRNSIPKSILANKNIKLTFFTGPQDGICPPQISDEDSSYLSFKSCYPILTKATSDYYYGDYDGVLICCFSNHQLVSALQEKAIEEKFHKISVTGIFHCSIHYCLLQNKSFSIITSNKEWVDLLNKAVCDILTKNGSGEKFLPSIWKGTVSSEVQVLDLHDPKVFDKIVDRIQKVNVEKLKSKNVILGCAGFSGMEHKFASRITEVDQFIDSVGISLQMVISFCNFNMDYYCQGKNTRRSFILNEGIFRNYPDVNLRFFLFFSFSLFLIFYFLFFNGARYLWPWI